MEKFKLYYADSISDLTGNINVQEFDSFDSMIDFIDEKHLDNRDVGRQRNVVFLLAVPSSNAIIVHDNSIHIQTQLLPVYRAAREFHLHEYSSFEEAYTVALNMNEGHPLCYSRN